MNDDRFISVDIDGLDKAHDTVDGFPRLLQNTLRRHSVLKEIGTVLVASGEQTISEGGRPVKYKPLAESTIARKGSSKPLIDKDTLRQSLDYETYAGKLYLTSVEYLKYHQWEEDRDKAPFPARPIWHVQDEDKEEITDIIIDNVSKNL